MAEHIHWKKTTNPAYLGAYDFDDGKDMIVQIKDVKPEMVQNQQGREEKQIMYFEGNIKPWILNTTNMKTIANVCGSNYFDEWVGKKIQLYVTLVSAFGTTTDAVRVREFAPRS